MKRIIPLSLLSISAACTTQADQQRPNIIFILADDLGYGDIGPYGQKLIDTPNLDILAQKGTVFTDCYAGCTVSAPSRASLMTGLHTGHTFIRGNLEVYPEGQAPMPADTKTIGTVLQEAGYITGIFGKWGLGYPGSGSEPTDMGFDRFYGFNCQRKSHSHYPEYLWDDTQKDSLIQNKGRARQVYAPDVIHNRAKEFIKENASQPFFAFLSYTLPHAELAIQKDSIWNDYRNRFSEAQEDYVVWNDNGDYYTCEHPVSTFAAMVSRLDQYVGEIVALVEEHGLSQNTLIVFSSDNGPHTEGGANPGFFDSNSIYRGVKRDLYEGGIRVPMIVSCPSYIPQGRVSDQQMAFWDLMPTFADIAGVESEIITDGISMLDEWKGETQAEEHEFLYWEFHEGGGKRAVRMGDWKGVLLGVKTGENIFELYNLKEDPSERENIAEKHPDIVKQILDIMNKEHIPIL